MDEANGYTCSCCCGILENQKLSEELAAADANFISETLTVKNLDCADCAAKVEKAIRRLDGIADAQLSFPTGKMKVVYDGTRQTTASIEKVVANLGYPVEVINASHDFPGFCKSVFIITGLDCGDCAAKLEKKINGIAGVKTATVNFGAGKLTVEHTNSASDLLKAIQEAGYQGELEGKKQSITEAAKGWWHNARLLATVIAGTLLAAVSISDLLGLDENILLPIYILTLVIGGYHTARSGFYSLKSLTFDMNFLMSIAVLGAAAIGQWNEAATVVFLFSLGNTLQAYTMDKTRQSIKSLMELAPPEAIVRRNGLEELLPIEEIRVGDVIIVKPGEKIPMDGDVINGVSSVNQATITGESMPVEKHPGDIVYAGTVNEHGSLEISVTKLSQDSTLSKIMYLVEEAQAKKAPSQQFVDRFAKYYTPAVMILALGISIVPWLFFGQAFDVWFYRALVLLVISCPCALVISTPVSIVSAIGNASRHGVLIKGGAYLEKMESIRAVALDKTGTLTKGHPTVTDIIAYNNLAQSEILAIAAAIERYSEHPVAQAIVRKVDNLPTPPVKNFKALVGKGVQADVYNQTIYLGNLRLFEDIGHQVNIIEPLLNDLESQSKTVVLLGTGENLYGIIAVADVLRENSSDAVQTLRDAGIQFISMLTGDNNRVAKAISEKLKLDSFYSELLPEDKVRTVKKIGEHYGNVLMVGDGVNDAPALAAADIGVAMGVAGSDTALETADIALMADDLSKLSYVIQLGRKTVNIIKQNIWFSIIIKAVFLILTIFGISNLWMAVFADTGAAILVTLNGMRLVRELKY
ncbi:MAG: cadmium-translocating P-type ATPase [Veillonellaceae bacterium]|nr:cadmium-translocating P-type ATPase [Veillonellaceae bacterium]